MWKLPTKKIISKNIDGQIFGVKKKVKEESTHYGGTLCKNVIFPFICRGGGGDPILIKIQMQYQGIYV